MAEIPPRFNFRPDSLHLLLFPEHVCSFSEIKAQCYILSLALQCLKYPPTAHKSPSTSVNVVNIIGCHQVLDMKGVLTGYPQLDYRGSCSTLNYRKILYVCMNCILYMISSDFQGDLIQVNCLILQLEKKKTVKKSKIHL